MSWHPVTKDKNKAWSANVVDLRSNMDGLNHDNSAAPNPDL